MQVTGKDVGLDGTLPTGAFNDLSPGGARIVEDGGVVGMADGRDKIEVPRNASLSSIIKAVQTAQTMGLPARARPQRIPRRPTSSKDDLEFIRRQYPSLLSVWDRNNDGIIEVSITECPQCNWQLIGRTISEHVLPEHLLALESAVAAIAPNSEVAWQLSNGVRANPEYKNILKQFQAQY